MDSLRERLMMWVAIIGAVAMLAGGVTLARKWQDALWVQRSGAAVVCFEGLVVLAEFSRRWRIRALEDALGHSNPYLRREAIRAERRLVVIGFTLAVIGEGVHGFGDLAFEHAPSLPW